MRYHLRIALAMMICLLLAGCGVPSLDGAASLVLEPTPVSTHTPTPEPTHTPTPEPTPEPTEVVETPVAAEDLVDEVVDTPELSENVAPPTLETTPTPSPEELRPVRLVVPSIQMDMPLIAVGLDANRIPIVPKHDVGWYEYSAMPGQGDNIVLWGHVSRWLDSPNIPAPFGRMKEVQVGQEMMVYTANSAEHRYVVTETVQVRPDQVQYILPTDTERLTLVSCIGDQVVLDGTLTREFRLITIAEPVR